MSSCIQIIKREKRDWTKKFVKLISRYFFAVFYWGSLWRWRLHYKWIFEWIPKGTLTACKLLIFDFKVVLTWNFNKCTDFKHIFDILMKFSDITSVAKVNSKHLPHPYIKFHYKQTITKPPGGCMKQILSYIIINLINSFW